MSDRPEDLWPAEFETSVPDPLPVQILKQQAGLLPGKTNGLLEGVVKESTVEATVFYSLYLAAPSLGEYMFKILYVAIPITELRTAPFPPVVAEDSFVHQKFGTSDPESFKEWLRSVLNSEAIKGVVSNMLRRSSRTVAS